MPMRLIKLLSIFLVFLLFLTNRSFAQFGAMPPFTISIEAIPGTTIPGMHSFAFAKSGDKWLIIGGRTVGLHGLNVSGSFPPEYKNDKVTVIDTSTWTSYSADLNQLPWAVADPMRSTNMEYIQEGDYLYMIGGFGYDSTVTKFVTFSVLTAIHVDDMIDAVINAQPIASHIRQISDAEFVICGGELGKIGNDYYLGFGHSFKGRYDHAPGSPLFIQNYNEQIKKFNLTDDGTTISISGWSFQADTNNFHRRDMNMGPIINYDNSFGLRAYGGVFQKAWELPFREPITINAGATTVHTYQQVMSHYTCAMLPVYDSSTQNMYTTFFGGISLYDYDTGTGSVNIDTLCPFISDVTTLTAHSSGLFEETILPVQLPGLLGSNARFVLNDAVAHYSNEVLRLRNMPNTKTLAGYIFGGIRAEAGNFGNSTANDSVYRIYITPNNNVGIEEINSVQNAQLFPNPGNNTTTLIFTLKNDEQVNIGLFDITGSKVIQLADEEMHKGNQKISIDISKLNSGIYICNVQTTSCNRLLKLVVNR